MNKSATLTNNPLLLGSGLPPFADIKPEHIVPVMTQLLAELDQELATLEANLVPTWDRFIQPLERLQERLNWSWGVVSHLREVKNSPELREAYETVQPDVSEFLNNIEAITATGRRFRDTVLALGGSKHPMEVFESFRGRQPSTEPLLRHRGFVSSWTKLNSFVETGNREQGTENRKTMCVINSV